jgi:hypothetical protein
MRPDAADDVTRERLGHVSRLMPDQDRAERLRLKCRKRLERGRRQEAPAAMMMGLSWRLVMPVVGGFCVLYVVALVATTLRLEGFIE